MVDIAGDEGLADWTEDSIDKTTNYIKSIVTVWMNKILNAWVGCFSCFLYHLQYSCRLTITFVCVN